MFIEMILPRRAMHKSGLCLQNVLHMWRTYILKRSKCYLTSLMLCESSFLQLEYSTEYLIEYLMDTGSY